MGSGLRCSRTTTLAGLTLERWYLTNADSAPGGEYNQPRFDPWVEVPFETRGALGDGNVVDLLLHHRSWSELPINTPYQFAQGEALAEETPASFSPPYDVLCGSVLDVENRYVAVGPPDYYELLAEIYAGGPYIFHPYYGGFGYGGSATTWWGSVPLHRYIQDLPPYNSCFQNLLWATRCKYRVTGVYLGWEASCDLWIQYYDTTVTPNVWRFGWRTDAYPKGMDMLYTRMWAKDWWYRRPVTTARFPYQALSPDTTTAWNEILLPEREGDFYEFWPAAAMDGFIGRAIFHIFEPEEAWSVRTGWTVRHKLPPRRVDLDRQQIDADREIL